MKWKEIPKQFISFHSFHFHSLLPNEVLVAISELDLQFYIIFPKLIFLVFTRKKVQNFHSRRKKDKSYLVKLLV